MTLFILAGIVVVISGLLALFNVSSTYNAVVADKLDYASTTEAINSLFNLRGIKYIFSNTVLNFANFTVLSHLIIVLLGIGIMEYSGFLRLAIGLLTKKAPKKLITFTIVFFCIIASIMDNLPFVAFIPLAALIFKHGKRNPNIGVIASFAALTCGYGLSIFMTSIDSALRTLTITAAKILDVNYKIGVYSTMFIMIVGIIILSIVITYITENIIAKKLPKYEFDENEVLEDDGIVDKHELRGLIFAISGSLLYLIIFIYNIIPGLPFSGNFLNYSETLYIDKLFGANSFFNSGFIFVITFMFFLIGFLYGLGAKTIENHKDVCDFLSRSLDGIGKVIILLFFASIFVSLYKYTNIGGLITAVFSNIIYKSNFTGLPLVALIIFASVITTVFLPSI